MSQYLLSTSIISTLRPTKNQHDNLKIKNDLTNSISQTLLISLFLSKKGKDAGHAKKGHE